MNSRKYYVLTGKLGFTYHTLDYRRAASIFLYSKWDIEFSRNQTLRNYGDVHLLAVI